MDDLHQIARRGTRRSPATVDASTESKYEDRGKMAAPLLFRRLVCPKANKLLLRIRGRRESTACSDVHAQSGRYLPQCYAVYVHKDARSRMKIFAESIRRDGISPFFRSLCYFAQVSENLMEIMSKLLIISALRKRRTRVSFNDKLSNFTSKIPFFTTTRKCHPRETVSRGSQ